MEPKISVIVPVYNVEKYLKINADSILNQTWKNFELIFVDDGSPDQSGKICDEYKLLDKRVKVIHKKNEGLGFARNTGLEIAEGEYVTFVDSDDYMEPDMIEKLMQPIIKNGADTVIGGFKRVDDDGNILYREQYKNQIFKGKDVFCVFMPKILGSCPKKHDSFRMSVWNAVYSMKIIRENNVKFPSERVMISEDMPFDLDYYKYSKCVAVIDSLAYNYRLNPNSLTNKYKEGKVKLVTYFYEEMERRVNKAYKGAKSPVLRLQSQFFIKLRGCVKQENTKLSGTSFIQNYRKIRAICCDPVVQRVVVAYPLNRLNFKQKAFVLMLKFKCALTLALLAEIGKI